MLEALDQQEQRRDAELTAATLENLKLRSRIKRGMALIKQKEELAEGLHMIDFEQLKIENQTFSEKIEERNEELAKLRRKITTIVQILTHVKEKHDFCHTEADQLRRELKVVEEKVAVERDQLPYIKVKRDQLRKDNEVLKQQTGLLGNKMLLRDYEKKVVR